MSARPLAVFDIDGVLADIRHRLHLVEGLLTAILDIDEVIQLIRSSDNAEMARNRLISVFDLTEIQANYILDMPLLDHLIVGDGGRYFSFREAGALTAQIADGVRA